MWGGGGRRLGPGAELVQRQRLLLNPNPSPRFNPEVQVHADLLQIFSEHRSK